MGNHKLTLLVSAAALLAALLQGCAQAPHKDGDLAGTDADLATLDRQLQEAMVSGDVALLDQHLGEDHVFTHGWLTGEAETKADVLSNAKKQERLHLSRKVSSQVVERHGNVALVLGRLDVHRRPLASNKETQDMCYGLHYIHLYVVRNGQWQFISHRTSGFVEPRKPCGQPSNNSFKPKPLRGSA